MQNPDIIVAGITGAIIPENISVLLENDCALLVCSEKTREIIKDKISSTVIQKWIAFVPLKICFEQIEKATRNGTVVVLTSGDPLFFGFGTTVKKQFPKLNIDYIPAVSSMQLCFSRFGISWENASFFSLHGRPISELKKRLHEEQLFLLTDQKNSPEKISRYILDSLGSKKTQIFMVYVGENLGFTKERIVSGTLEEISEMRFGQPNCMIIHQRTNTDDQCERRFGLKESEIIHSRGLITKNEVRAVVLHGLALPEEGIMWDVGAGSGSVSIESARMCPRLSIYAIEKNHAEIANIRHNKNKFNCHNVTIIRGEAPDALTTLPVPDRVFIGGSGGNMETIISYLAKTGKKGLNVVVTGVTEITRKTTPALFVKYGFYCESSTLSVERTNYFEDRNEQKAFNTIQIFRANKRDE